MRMTKFDFTLYFIPNPKSQLDRSLACWLAVAFVADRELLSTRSSGGQEKSTTQIGARLRKAETKSLTAPSSQDNKK